MKNFYAALDVAVSNLKRLNRLRIAGKLDKEGWKNFFLYKQIVKKQDTGCYTEEVNNIIKEIIK